MLRPVDRILDFLAQHKTRATYGAVAAAAGVPAQSVGRLLGPRCPRTSWVVRADTLEPTGYSTGEKDPRLYTTGEVIRTRGDLISRMKREP
jgi:alkylated DNA nucleotide flippase Atl1